MGIEFWANNTSLRDHKYNFWVKVRVQSFLMSSHGWSICINNRKQLGMPSVNELISNKQDVFYYCLHYVIGL